MAPSALRHEIRLDAHNLDAVRPKRAFLPRLDKLPAVGGAQKLGNIRRHQLDDMLLKRLPRIQRRGFAHGLFGPVRVAAPKLGEATDQGHGIVGRFDFDGWQRGLPRLGGLSAFALFLGRLRLARGRQAGHAASAADLHGRCRADIRSRRHGGQGGCIEDESPSACRVRAGRGDIADHGDGRRQNGFDDLPRA